MSGRARVLVITLLTVFTPVLTGCLAGEDEGDGEPVTNESAGNATNPEDLPQGRDGEFSAFKETNQTEEGSGGMAHDHDYWQGRSRVRLFEEHAKIYPEPDADGRYTAVFRPPLGALVYEGTAKVELLVTNPRMHACEPVDEIGGQHVCTDNLDYYGAPTALPTVPHPSPPTLEVEFLHGASNPNEYETAGPIEWDTPLTINVPDPKWTDMPHSTASLWTFKFVAPNGQSDSVLVFDVAVDLVRADGEKIPEWPGHPDFYAETCCRKILDAAGEYAETAGETTAKPSYSLDKLISYGTRTLYVWANITSVTAPPGQMPSNIFLNFHNASAQNWNITSPFDENHTADKTEHLWILHVDDNAMDTPYATQSRWEFIVQGSHTIPPEPAPGFLACYGECFTYSVSYNLAIIATNEELPPEMYDRPRASIPVR